LWSLALWAVIVAVAFVIVGLLVALYQTHQENKAREKWQEIENQRRERAAKHKAEVDAQKLAKRKLEQEKREKDAAEQEAKKATEKVAEPTPKQVVNPVKVTSAPPRLVPEQPVKPVMQPVKKSHKSNKSKKSNKKGKK
jgi:hypothetical protein